MRFGQYLTVAAAVCAPAASASAATYYVGPASSQGILSSDRKSPGTLAFAVAHAPSGSTVILEDGVYEGAPDGFNVTVSGITFQALNWHGATVMNSTGATIWEPKENAHATNDICRGIVFGPCAVPKGDGWSGGGGDGWKFLDCMFVRNDGMGFGSNGVVEHCLFSDQWMNSFDVNNCTGFTMRNTIVRRGNRANADNDATGNKCDFAFDATFDGLIAYDNVGAALWFDTNNKNWLVKNSTIFGNHGSKDWFNFGVAKGISSTQFSGYGQDGEGMAVGEQVIAVNGTAANLHHTATVTAITGWNPQTVTISPALPSPIAEHDGFAVQHGKGGSTVGVMSEANPNGSFIDNVTYNNTGSGFLDADSGNGYGVNKAGMTITGNHFFYDGIGFRDITLGAKDPTRQLGSATIHNNVFKIGAMTGRNAFHPGSGNYLLGYPGPKYAIDFDYNTYSPDAGYTGSLADWYYFAGGPRTDFHADSLDTLHDSATWNQDHHSTLKDVPFRGRLVHTFDWPGDETDWSHIYHPNNVYGASATIHQIDDDETPYIQNALVHGKPGQTVTLKVFGHTPFYGSGPYTCEVYDYSGRWLQLTLPTQADRDALDTAVPPYAVLNASTVTVKLTSAGPYTPTAVYAKASRDNLAKGK